MIKMYKRKVNEYKIGEIITKFVRELNVENMIVYWEITKYGYVKIHSNKPGIIIGKHGTDINRLSDLMKKYCNVKEVNVYEMRHYIITNGSHKQFGYTTEVDFIDEDI